MYAAMAGNIIPAIATTNAVIAGLIVMEALKILSNNFNKCSTVRFEFTVLYDSKIIQPFRSSCDNTLV